MTEGTEMTEMKQATENALALITALASGDPAVLDLQLVEAVEWVGLSKSSGEGQRLALQLNQSAQMTKLALELVAQSSGLNMEDVTARFGTLVSKFNLG